jgi:hypothetical protein
MLRQTAKIRGKVDAVEEALAVHGGLAPGAAALTPFSYRMRRASSNAPGVHTDVAGL